MLYGTYYHKGGKNKLALEQYKLAFNYMKDSAELNYNTGLLLFDMKQTKESHNYAKEAYRLGYPLPALKLKLKKIGVWK